MKQTNKQQKIKTPRAAYAGFLFQTFFRRPFGYIIACLYVVYLAVILLIVPSILQFDPLFIWNVGGFNMPVFNLFFIAASVAALAVSIFRTGREDGTELSLSSKPLTKGSMVAMKVLVYLIIMCMFAVVANIVTGLVQPVFGWYNAETNIHGITQAQYIGLNLSVLVGNLINMLFFGGIAVLISMVGGQVITMIGTIGIVFIMCLMNFLYPQIVTSSLEVLTNKYDAEIMSYSANTLDQYISGDKSEPKKFATILCSVDESGEEKQHFDTREYWLKAERESGGMATNYIDFARQLSSTFSAFGLDDSKLKEASKLSIGMNRGYKYDIDASTHVALQENIDAYRYPIAFYSMANSQGFQYPVVFTLGGDMSIDKTNWYGRSVLNQYDFASASVLTNGSDSILMSSDAIREEYVKPYKRLNELAITEQQIKDTASIIYPALLSRIESATEKQLKTPHWFSDMALEVISTYGHDIFFEEIFTQLNAQKQHDAVAKAHMACAVIAQRHQNLDIEQYAKNKGIEDHFPFKSSTVIKWYNDRARIVAEVRQAYYNEFMLGKLLFDDTIQVRALPSGSTDPLIKGYDKLVISKLNYAETYSNLYVYNVENFFTVRNIIIVWSLVSVIFFAGSIIIYKKIDLK